MTYAKLTITVPQALWIGEVSRAHPETSFRVLAATANETAGTAQIELLGREAGAVCEEIRDFETVSDFTLFESDPGRRLIQVETTVPVLLTSIQASGVPLDMPFEISDGEMMLEATIPQQQLSRLGESLDEFGISYTVERIQQEVTRDSLLTDRQYGLLEEAIDHGYYDTPRRTTLTDLAAELDIAKSTCSEVLHRAEENILKEFICDHREHQYETPVVAD